MDHDDRRILAKKAPFQVDPKITRPQLVSAHTKWLLCDSAFWVLENKCEKKQKFVPDGYFFETGRPAFEGSICSELTGNGDVPVVKTCRIKQGKVMVLPVVNQPYTACNTDGTVEDPRIGPAALSPLIPYFIVHKADLDGAPVDYLDSLNVITQDGDMDSRLSGDATCVDYNGLIPTFTGCALGAVGPYVFINTSKLTKGKHELVLIGENDGFCSAVKHKFTIV